MCKECECCEGPYEVNDALKEIELVKEPGRRYIKLTGKFGVVKMDVRKFQLEQYFKL